MEQARSSFAIVTVFVSTLSIESWALAQQLSDRQIREWIVAEDIAAYSGNCPCPYNRASNGSRCGRRSAWSRTGGFLATVLRG